MDNEIKGEGNSINYTHRMHDPRVGRFFTVDPLAPKYPNNSPYTFSQNRVIDGVELEGLQHTFYFLALKEIDGTEYLTLQKAVEIDNKVSTILGDVQLSNFDFTYIYGSDNHWHKMPDKARNQSLYALGETHEEILDEINKWEIADYQAEMAIIHNNIGVIGEYYTMAVAIYGNLHVQSAFKGSAATRPSKKVKSTNTTGVAGNQLPKVQKGTQTKESFITEHAFSRHKYDATKISTRSKTQYGKNVDAEYIRKETMNNPDDIVKHFDNKGNHYATTYKKKFESNISTNDTPTRESRVIINHVDPNRSTQFPLYKQEVTDGF